MKLGYYAYFLEGKKSKKKYQHDIAPFLRAFCKLDNPSFKNSILSLTDENVYLFQKTKTIFLFVMTKSHEIIKKIDTKTIDVDEIYSKLGRDDKLGFASYIYFGSFHYGIASTIQGPKNKILCNFINCVIEKIGINGYEFKSFAIMHQASKKEVLTLPFIGKTIVQVGEGNSFFDHLVGFVGGKAEDVDSFVIEIKPKKRKYINNTFSKFSAKLNDKGLLKYIVRAKESQEDALEDFYISCEGGVCDLIYGKDDSSICKEIADKAINNTTLLSKLSEIKNDKKFASQDIQAFSNFNEPNSWTTYLSDL